MVIASDFAHNFNNVESATCGFPAPIEFLADTAGIGLIFIFDEKNLVNDRGCLIEREFLQGVSDRSGDEVGMAGASADNTTKGNYAIWLLFLNECFANHGDFKSPRNALTSPHQANK